MKILEISEYYFGLGGILVLNKSQSASIVAFIKNIFVVLYMGPFMCETSAAFIYYHPDQFENCVKAFVAVCGGILVTGKYLSLKLNGDRIKKLIEKFRETVDEAPIYIRKLYFNAETKGRRLTKTTVKIMFLSWVVAFGLFAVVSALYNIMLGQLDTQQWFQIAYLVIPYENQLNAVPRYFLKLIITLVICFIYGTSVTLSITFLIHCHDLIEVGFCHIKSLFVEMDELAQRNSQSNFQEIKIRMVRVVELHIRLIELSELLSKIMSGPIFFHLLCNIGLAAGTLNLVKIDDFDFTTAQCLFGVLSSIFWIFLYCYFATRITTMLEEIGDVAYQSQWYNYPTEVRKCVLMIIKRAQVPIRFTGLKMFNCDMIVYASILRLIFSYYLMLRKINSN